MEHVWGILIVALATVAALILSKYVASFTGNGTSSFLGSAYAV